MYNKPENNPDKASLRQQMLAARQALPAQQRQQMDTRICSCIVQAAADVGPIAGYVAANGEPDIMPALTELYECGHSIYLPVVDPLIRGQMQFGNWTPGMVLKRNRFGIGEPDGLETLPAADLDLVFMPLLGYSAEGQRVGMGSGYYDRSFSISAAAKTPLLCGIAYSMQQAQFSTADAWDIPMDAVVTEHGRFTFNR